ncbi:DUF6869 domain-containing protein [Methylobacterium radiotolerans]|uniref:DUF6869 domain-containing protein n=1 Tax=Methylobacterium radiotolerans TaxID=31998 RepID=UPI00119369C9|nr:hypothetical protein [Methylobacterium radiotolerans]GEN01950.1 hypothetical protein MRA01_64890 [Methylobacterium radiotolerans]
MSAKTYSSEIERALARPDAGQMRQQLLAYAKHHAEGDGDWPEELADDFDEILLCRFEDPEKALAYVIIAASQSDDAKFLALLACGNLEDVLRDPAPELLERIVAEARKSARFRWLLSHPFKVAVADQAWDAIEQFRITGPHEEPPRDQLPPRD